MVGNSFIEFKDLQISEAVSNQEFEASCSSNQGHFLQVTSLIFHSYHFPDTAMLRKTEITMVFKGPYHLVEKMLKTFKPEYGTLTCEGCPPSARSGVVGHVCDCFSPLAEENCDCWTLHNTNHTVHTLHKLDYTLHTEVLTKRLLLSNSFSWKN